MLLLISVDVNAGLLSRLHHPPNMAKHMPRGCRPLQLSGYFPGCSLEQPRLRVLRVSKFDLYLRPNLQAFDVRQQVCVDVKIDPNLLSSIGAYGFSPAPVVQNCLPTSVRFLRASFSAGLMCSFQLCACTHVLFEACS